MSSKSTYRNQEPWRPSGARALGPVGRAKLKNQRAKLLAERSISRMSGEKRDLFEKLRGDIEAAQRTHEVPSGRLSTLVEDESIESE